jgi:hypothetical protein
MFKLQPNPTFWAKVPLTVPGKSAPVMLDFEFHYLAEDERKNLFENRTAQEVALEIVADWKGIDEPFSQEALGKLYKNYARAVIDVLETYNRELLESRRKN